MHPPAFPSELAATAPDTAPQPGELSQRTRDALAAHALGLRQPAGDVAPEIAGRPDFTRATFSPRQDGLSAQDTPGAGRRVRAEDVAAFRACFPVDLLIDGEETPPG